MSTKSLCFLNKITFKINHKFLSLNVKSILELLTSNKTQTILGNNQFLNSNQTSGFYRFMCDFYLLDFIYDY